MNKIYIYAKFMLYSVSQNWVNLKTHLILIRPIKEVEEEPISIKTMKASNKLYWKHKNINGYS